MSDRSCVSQRTLVKEGGGGWLRTHNGFVSRAHSIRTKASDFSCADEVTEMLVARGPTVVPFHR